MSISNPANPVTICVKWTELRKFGGKVHELPQPERRLLLRLDTGREQAVVRIINGPTGHEIIKLDRKTLHGIRLMAEQGLEWEICPGKVDQFANCRISASELLDAVQQLLGSPVSV
ncbi:hypothetical protein [Parachitinimonas caeni]|uniref:Uncharacterized protein n=1 Tax=Parachitinimonas caeni TaxID=3031301 RepID=A0ABT7E357_9NEIS|nr:hypothetical protein [Parachitinimonas caeni]MDK2126757.1 hypothetical protein [Parachitinimonas caeni]